MNSREAAKVLGQMIAAFPRGPWPEETENWWLRELVIYDYRDASQAVKRLALTSQHTPSWAAFAQATAEYTRRRLAREQQQQQAALPVGDQQRTFDGAARDAMDRGGARLEHRHVPDASACPICKHHDHTDRTVVGFHTLTEYRTQPNGERVAMEMKIEVPAWHVTCPRCGQGVDALNTMSAITPAGIEIGRRLRGEVAVHTEASTF